MAPSVEGRLCRSSGVVAQPFENGLVIVNARSGTCWELNQIGAEVWGLLSEPRDVAQICDTLAKTYPVAHDTLFADVRALVSDLIHAGLIELWTQPAEAGRE